MDYSVLIVDDETELAESTAEYFNILDVKTAYVTSFDAAVDFLGKNNVSLLLLDMLLPMMACHLLQKKM